MRIINKFINIIVIIIFIFFHASCIQKNNLVKDNSSTERLIEIDAKQNPPVPLRL